MEDGRHEEDRDKNHYGGIAGIRTARPSEPIRFIDAARVAIEIDASIYSQDAILRATYKFTDRGYVLLQSHDVPAHCCIAHLIAKSPLVDLGVLVGEFCNELLDQQLRQRLESQFGDIRSLIVAEAFAEGNLLDRDRDEGDYMTDSRGIGGPPR
jgi:His-Xaa-Ser system protein HxsD